MNYYQYPPWINMCGGYPPMYSEPNYGYSQQQNVDLNEQSYIENILRLNIGKNISVYMNFENSQWGSKIFKGTLEAAGKDHIIISDQQTNIRYMLLSIYLNYVTFDDEINYYYPYSKGK